MPRNSSDGNGLSEAARALPVHSDISVLDSPLSTPFKPFTLVSELRVNGTNLRVPVEDHYPGHARVLQCIAELAHFADGFRVFGAGPLLRASIQFSAIRDVCGARLHALQLRNQLIGLVNTIISTLVSGGGGCKDIEAQVHKTSETGALLDGTVIVEIPEQSDVRAIDTLIEHFSPLIERLTSGARSGCSINEVADRQLLCARVTLDPCSLSLEPKPGQALVERIVGLHNFACMTKDRVSARDADVLATTNSMRGAIGCANDSAGTGRTAWTAHEDHGAPLAIWYRDHHGHLAGRISLPVLAEQLDTTAATVRMPSALSALAATVPCTYLFNPAVAAIGLAQSLANFHAHAAAAIARSNTGQHAYDLALLVGARGSEIAHVVKALVSAQSVRCDLAVTALDKVRWR